MDGQGNLERTWNVREKSGNSEINGYGTLTSENSLIMFKRGKYVLSKPITLLIGATLKGKNLLPKGANFFL